MKTEIIRLELADFEKCGNIWDLQKHRELAEQFRREIHDGIRLTYIYQIDGEFIGEISLVTDTEDPDYTVSGQRIYLSRLIIKEGYRRQGIGRRLTDHAIQTAAELGYSEISVGVDLDNYPALKLYHEKGFDTILYIGEDEWGKYVKLMKRIF